MAKRKPVESFTDDTIVFEHEGGCYRLLQLDPNSMNVTICPLDGGKEQTFPFAHLPKIVKKRIRPR